MIATMIVTRRVFHRNIKSMFKLKKVSPCREISLSLFDIWSVCLIVLGTGYSNMVIFTNWQPTRYHTKAVPLSISVSLVLIIWALKIQCVLKQSHLECLTSRKQSLKKGWSVSKRYDALTRTKLSINLKIAFWCISNVSWLPYVIYLFLKIMWIFRFQTKVLKRLFMCNLKFFLNIILYNVCFDREVKTNPFKIQIWMKRLNLKDLKLWPHQGNL